MPFLLDKSDGSREDCQLARLDCLYVVIYPPAFFMGHVSAVEYQSTRFWHEDGKNISGVGAEVSD